MSIEDTSKRDPLLHFVGALGDSERYITEMEKAGQTQLVNSDRIPTAGPVDELLALGFTVGEPDPADPLFRPATLPDGWRRDTSDHDMHSNILDANGRTRVRIFYKAAFYDRCASFSVVTPAAYVTELLWSTHERAALVDEWTTRDVLVEEITKARADELAEAEDQDSYYPKGAVAARARAARCDRLLVALGQVPA